MEIYTEFVCLSRGDRHSSPRLCFLTSFFMPFGEGHFQGQHVDHFYLFDMFDERVVTKGCKHGNNMQHKKSTSFKKTYSERVVKGFQKCNKMLRM
jgi:hypothetical protein